MFGKEKVKKKNKQEKPAQKKEKKFGYKEEEDNDWMVRFSLRVKLSPQIWYEETLQLTCKFFIGFQLFFCPNFIKLCFRSWMQLGDL